MPKPTKGARLGGGAAHERALLANLAQSLFEHGRITTTETRAKRLQPLAERLITKAKRGDLHSRRQVQAVIRNKTIHVRNAPGDAKTVVHRLFTEIAPAMADRNGGYTRITKVGTRKGDNAQLVVIELVLEPVSAKPSKAATKVTKKAAEKVEPVEETVVNETVEAEEVAETPAEEVVEAEETAEVEADAVEATEADVEEADSTKE